jgi:hypothetical protein
MYVRVLERRVHVGTVDDTRRNGQTRSYAQVVFVGHWCTSYLFTHTFFPTDIVIEEASRRQNIAAGEILRGEGRALRENRISAVCTLCMYECVRSTAVIF